MMQRISVRTRLLAACIGLAGVAITDPAFAAPCGGDHPLTIGVFGPLTGASKDFGEMALESVKLAVADF